MASDIPRWVRATAFVVACELVGISGALVTTPDSAWYRELAKPWFQPPSWLFGPVWTLLYALMGIAAFLVFERRRDDARAAAALGWFALQLALNGLWTPMFFGLHRLQLGLVVLVALWLVLLVTTLRFLAVRRAAGWLLVPYQLWVTFALALNGAIVRLN